MLLWLWGLFHPAVSHAAEVAPRISDREIIESLAELRAGQQSLQQQINDLKQSTQQQIGTLRQEMNQRFEDMNRRLDDMNRRLDDVMTLLQILLGALTLVLGSMLAWLVAIWRRLVRVEERQRAFETQDDEIKFLKENYTRLHDMLLRLLPPRP